MEEIASAQQITEYESQLAGIDELLAASPTDESLLALKADLVELLRLSRADMNVQQPQQLSQATNIIEPDISLPSPPRLEIAAVEQAVSAGAAAAAIATEDDKPSSGLFQQPPQADPGSTKKKTKKLKDFVVPPHLIVSEGDSEADIKKKRRALKALKSQHREKRKEVEHEHKQKSWQSFQKKKKTSSSGVGGSDSIFSTQDSVNDRVGVISTKRKTEFGQRKRHKPSL
jgi:survival-of-motor-neuron-related-splicing factor 30